MWNLSFSWGLLIRYDMIWEGLTESFFIALDWDVVSNIANRIAYISVEGAIMVAEEDTRAKVATQHILTTDLWTMFCVESVLKSTWQCWSKCKSRILTIYLYCFCFLINLFSDLENLFFMFFLNVYSTFKFLLHMTRQIFERRIIILLISRGEDTVFMNFLR